MGSFLSSGKFKITNEDRIKRILERVASRHLNVLIRLNDEKKIGIRAKFDAFDASAKVPIIMLNGISSIGYEKLKGQEAVKVEVIGMPTQVVFFSKIIRLGFGSILLSSPSSLINIERRANARYKTVPSRMAYIEFSDISERINPESSPPSYPYYQSFDKWVPIADLSIGGASCISPFPYLLQYYHSTKGHCKARLVSPMMDPFDLELEFRWQKVLKTQVENAPEGYFSRRFLFGIQFAKLDEETLKKVKFQLTQLSMADAV